MRFPSSLVFIVTVLASLPVAADHPSCGDLRFDYSQLDAAQMRAIAATCESQAEAQLYYNRAFHADLMAEYARFRRLITLDRSGSGAHLESYRIFIPLLETFASRVAADDPGTIALLNENYQRQGDEAELRLKGYDLLPPRAAGR